jgi:hypothetical protein
MYVHQLDLELIQARMAHKPLLWVEADARAVPWPHPLVYNGVFVFGACFSQLEPELPSGGGADNNYTPKVELLKS